MPITSTIQQGTLSLAAVTPGNSAIGDAAAAGTSASVARADHKHGREASGTPGASAVGDTASTGSATTVALSDHRHSREAFGTPVNLDASVTSLSAGSLTTVARADHVHTVSKVPVLIASTTLASTAASITFSSIPATYSALILYMTVKSARIDYYDNMYLRFNNDTAGNYNDQLQGTSATSLGAFTINAASNFMSSMFSYHQVQIPQYASTAMHKLAVWTHNPNFNGSSSAWSPAVATGGFANVWKNTNAVNRIDLFCYTGPFAVSTSVQLYGIP